MTRSPRDLAHDRAMAQLYLDERLRELPERCRRIREAEDSARLAELLLRDLPYAAVTRLALIDQDVRVAVALLPADWRWLT